MHRIEVAVDGTGYQTWVASETAAAKLRSQILSAAESGATITVDIVEAVGDDLVTVGTLVLRLGSAASVAVRVVPDDRTGGAMGISH